MKGLDDVPEWQLGRRAGKPDTGSSVGLQPKRETSAHWWPSVRGSVAKDDMSFAMRHMVEGKRQQGDLPAEVLKAGDVVFVEKKEGEGDAYLLRQPPEVEGGLVAMDPHTGRVLAMVGGFSYAESEFNRATVFWSAQPGSSFAVRLRGGARQRLYAGLRDHGRTDHHPDGRHDLDLEEL